MLSMITLNLEAPDGTDAVTAEQVIEIYCDGQFVRIALPLMSTPAEISALLIAGANEL